MPTASTSFTAVGNGGNLVAKHKSAITYAVSGTFVATVILERSDTNGLSWESTGISATGSASGRFEVSSSDQGTVRFRFRCSAFTSGTVVTSIVNATSDSLKETEGAKDGTDAPAGFIGESAKSVVGPVNTGATTVRYDVTSLVLQPGRYLLSGQIYYSKNGATITAASGFEIQITTTSGNNTTGGTFGDNYFSSTFADVANVAEHLIQLANYYVSIDAPTTYYLKGRAVFSAGQPQHYGVLRAVRV